LWKAGYFKTGKLGLVYPDRAAVKRTVQVIKTRLASYGVAPKDEVAFALPENAANDTGSVAAGFSNDILQFRTEGVEHVLWVGTAGFDFYGYPQAESQQYHPAYALTTFESPNVIATNIPSTQLAGSMGVGWLPTSDLQHTGDPDDAQDTVRQKPCLQVA